MSTWELALRFVNLFLIAIVAGGQLFVAAAIIPGKRRWPLERSLRLQQDLLIIPPDRYLKPSVAITFATAVLILVLQRDLTSLPALLTILGLLATVTVMLISFLFNFQINPKVLRLSIEPLAPEYADLQRRWDTAHTARTVFSVLALMGYLAAGLLR